MAGLIQNLNGEEVSNLRIADPGYSERLYEHFGLPILSSMSSLTASL
jgi:hypothetical protein